MLVPILWKPIVGWWFGQNYEIVSDLSLIRSDLIFWSLIWACSLSISFFFTYVCIGSLNHDLIWLISSIVWCPLNQTCYKNRIAFLCSTFFDHRNTTSCFIIAIFYSSIFISVYKQDILFFILLMWNLVCLSSSSCK